jgi:hypothetical protein
MRIFLSHAVADKALVSAVINLLETGIGVPVDSIFCTSFDEQGIPAGEDFAPYMRKELSDKADVVIAIVTPQYYASPFCMCETGAAWAMQKKFIPLLAEPVDYDDLRGALYGKQGVPLNSEKKLDAMRDELDKLFPGGKVARWNNKKGEFLNNLPALLKALKPVGTISQGEADKLQAERDAARTEASQLDKEKEDLQMQVSQLKKAKDAKQVADIRKLHSTEEQEFEELVDEAKDALTELPRVARKALYCEAHGQRFNETFEEWGSDLEHAVQRDFIRDTGEELIVNDDHPPVAEALDKIRAVRDFLEVSSPGFQKSYTKLNKFKPSVGSLNFWEKHDWL